jgi:hypothetical protein
MRFRELNLQQKCDLQYCTVLHVVSIIVSDMVSAQVSEASVSEYSISCEQPMSGKSRNREAGNM